MVYSDDAKLGISYRRRRELDLEGEVQSGVGLGSFASGFYLQFRPTRRVNMLRNPKRQGSGPEKDRLVGGASLLCDTVSLSGFPVLNAYQRLEILLSGSSTTLYYASEAEFGWAIRQTRSSQQDVSFALTHMIGDEPFEESLRARLDLGGEIYALCTRRYPGKGIIDANQV
jgi:hypothetical protein